jgi:hypothetical protein
VKRFMVLFLLLSCTVAFAQKKKQAGKDPWIGNYKLDVAQSKISGQPPQQETVALSAVSKDSIKYTISGKDAQGESYTMNFDGKVGTAAPEMAEGKEIAQITFQMPSSHQLTQQARGTNGSTITGTVTLSPDNKTITVREHIKDSKGAEHDETSVYVRQ